MMQDRVSKMRRVMAKLKDTNSLEHISQLDKVTQAGSQPYKLAIIDYSMPQTMGTVVAQEFRQMISKLQDEVQSMDLQDIVKVQQPFMVCQSAYDDPFFMQLATASGMDQYHVKPVSQDTVDSILRETNFLRDQE